GTSNGDRPPTDGTQWLNTGYSDMHRHKYWHFVDTPFAQDGTTTLPAIPTTNAETEIAVCRQTLTLASTSATTDKLKSYDLVWLMHLVGDVHQSLRATTRVRAGDLDGDAGGNSVKLSSGNLHSYWDELPGDSSSLAKVIEYAKALSAA